MENNNISPFNDGKNTTLSTQNLTIVEKDGKKGVFNQQNQLVVSISYEEIIADGNLFKVKKDGFWGFIDQNENQIISPRYLELGIFNNNRIIFAKSKTGDYGIIDKDGKKVVPCTYREIGQFQKNGLAYIRKDKKGLYGYIDSNLEIVIPYIYKEAGNFISGYAIVAKDEQQKGLVDAGGQIVVPLDYERIIDYYAGTLGVVIVQKNGLYGVYDFRNKKKMKCVYSKINILGRDNEGALRCLCYSSSMDYCKPVETIVNEPADVYIPIFTKGEIVDIHKGKQFVEVSHWFPFCAVILETLENPLIEYQQDGKRRYSWEAREINTGEIISYCVTEGGEHYGPQLYEIDSIKMKSRIHNGKIKHSLI